MDNKSGVSGRGPTSDMSPISTLNSCGSSSSFGSAQKRANPRHARITGNRQVASRCLLAPASSSGTC